jgi:hypothetical protein
MYTQQSVTREQNREHQSAEIRNKIPVNNTQVKYFDTEEGKKCKAAQNLKIAFVNFFLPKRHRLFPRRRIFTR